MPEMACIRDRERGGKKKQQIWLISAAERSVGRSRSPPICPVPHPIAPATYQNIDSALPSSRCIQTETPIEARMRHPDAARTAQIQRQALGGGSHTGKGEVPNNWHIGSLVNYCIISPKAYPIQNQIIFLLTGLISKLTYLIHSFLECHISQRT